MTSLFKDIEELVVVDEILFDCDGCCRHTLMQDIGCIWNSHKPSAS